MQRIIYVNDDYSELDDYIKGLKAKKILLVCGASIRFLKYDAYFDNLKNTSDIEVIRFSDFAPNPQYESVVKGVELFREKKCNAIIAVGGGSVMDVAKCIKLFSNKDLDNEYDSYLNKKIIPNDVRLIVLPTTAGTGSEATQFAVIYNDGDKKSVDSYSLMPQAVIMDSTVLKSLPTYQKKAALLDALCHAMESYWSVNSSEESKEYSKQAIGLILGNINEYLETDIIDPSKTALNAGGDNIIREGLPDCYDNMQKAAYLAGKAINITRTTAGHAMCYKLTTLYGIAHGHAAALCVAKLFPYMVFHTEDCADKRGTKYLDCMFNELAKIMGCETVSEACELFECLLKKLELTIPVVSEKDYGILAKSVNAERLNNNPVMLYDSTIEMLYHKIFER